MLKQLLGATSLLALLAGGGHAALAQDAAGPTATPPGATPAPVATTPPPATPPPAAQAPGEQVPVVPVPPTPAAAATPGSSITTPADVGATPPQPGGDTPPSPTAAATAATPDPAATPAAAAEPAATPAASPGTAVSADDMMGRPVQGSDGEPLGRVSDVVIDAGTGTIQRLVIASGGFLGLGAKTVALDFGQVELRPEGGIVAKGLTQADVERLPVYDVSAETRPLTPPPAGPAMSPAGGLTGPSATTPGLTPEGGGGAAAPAESRPPQ